MFVTIAPHSSLKHLIVECLLLLDKEKKSIKFSEQRLKITFSVVKMF